MRVVSLYIHVPFCTRRCAYCSFFHVPREAAGEDAVVDALGAEIAHEMSTLADDVRLRSVFVGGGTPSVLSRPALSRLFDAFSPYVDSGVTREVTCEVNPEDVTVDLARFLAGLGVDRVSVGVQSMSPRAQRVLKRCGPDVNERAVGIVMDRFDNVSVDVLLGVPGADPSELETTLASVARWTPQHGSVYCLEPGGDMSVAVESFFDGVDGDRAADEYLRVSEFLAGNGYRHYEVSNYARDGFESVHNRVYWDGGEYVGVGPGAHSFVGGRRYSNAPSLDDYLARVGGERVAARVPDETDAYGLALERAMLALRTAAGAPLEWFPGRERVVDEMVSAGLCGRDGGRIVLTARGWLMLNEVVLRLTGAAV